ncbi:MAG: hypothetical protein ACR2OZ_12005 [Verrucomicrobiales bacterium]
MSANQLLIWNRGSRLLTWNGEEIATPGALLWAEELPQKNGIAAVTLFDESTPDEVPNAFIFEKSGKFQPLIIKEDGRLVRFLGCYSEGDQIVFNAANETEYLVNPESNEVISTRYYR